MAVGFAYELRVRGRLSPTVLSQFEYLDSYELAWTTKPWSSPATPPVFRSPSRQALDLLASWASTPATGLADQPADER